MTANDPLTLGDVTLHSRLILGTGKFSDRETMIEAIRRSGAELVTVALRRFNPARPRDDLAGPLQSLRQDGVHIMPNTSGAQTAKEAITAAHIARELCGSRFVKVEIHPNPHHLMPDPIETYEACRVLAAEDFIVMPYIPADPVLAKRLEDVGCASVMPLGSAIGSGHGLATVEMLRLILRDSGVPVIVDAGLRTPSEAAGAMELGCAGVLVNSAIAAAGQPVRMAAAFAAAVAAGREAYLGGLMPMADGAVATSPLTAFLEPAGGVR
ncbi:MAG: thiazole synthase [Lentisphaeria bacterium]|nr:thiazole synthase [Lentisphaeria bacterium]